MILREDCNCPCHRVGRRAVIHVMPCCGPNGPGCALVPHRGKRQKKSKIITLFPKQKP